ncbi:nitrite reductase small subunit NirD [Endozoicomonas numazuensis]|uniref:Nitrite reductase n=1 Tax=Endozoicomonas numazuensis TaxID=1137799 RepID=A0A081NFG8_9GAMM|nr:nitrite reductase small subunit NirD [Endozoicomonas numazuensis]KEQ17191.1 nitrite reductase [Endozoicomonas numazuensis]
MTQANKGWTTVCSEGDLIPNLGVCALVEGVQIALFKVDDQVYALDNHDPFSQANVISRGLVGDLEGKLVVASPIYKQHFELSTGQCLEDETVSLNAYPVEVVDQKVQVSLASATVEAA